ncbi:MAG: ISNCY family transposase [Acidobacteria bacterium]|nr:ISNCY family transposase [Acidobacteriota bacterium]
MRHYPEAAVERAMKVQEVILRAVAKKITWIQAAEILGVSPRHMRRWKEKYERFGFFALFDGRRGRASPRRVPSAVLDEVLRLYRERYSDLNVKHFHEKLTAEHGFAVSYTWTKGVLQGAGLVQRQPRRGTHRKRRARRPLPGMLLHIDASQHQWFTDERWHDLIVILDDATSAIHYAQLVEQESTRTVLRALREVVEGQGLFCSLYSDRASHFWLTPKAGEPVDRQALTQVGRAMRELNVQMIPAYSPQARGRSERSFRTWQGRLPQELRLAGITTLAEANRFLRERYVAEFNARFAVAAEGVGTAFVPCTRSDLDRVFCLQHERVVARDNTVSFARLTLQIERQQWRGTLAGCRVIVYEHLDGTLSIGYGLHEVGRYNSEGVPLRAAAKGAVKKAVKKRAA